MMVVDSSKELADVDVRPLINLTHVCSRWRNLLVDTPHMWTRTGCRDQDQLEAFALRARTLPLSLYIGTRFRRSCQVRRSDLKSILEPYAHRISRLDIPRLCDYDEATTQPPLWLSELSLPSLRCLKVSLEDTADDIPPLHPSNYTLFGSHTSLLKALAISWFSGSWIPSNHFVHLTHLYLAFCDGVRSIPASTVISILAQCPMLEIFHLLTDFADISPAIATSAEAPRALSLTRLRALTWTGCSGAIFRFLNLLDLPWDRVRLRVEGAVVNSSADSLSQNGLLEYVTALEVFYRFTTVNRSQAYYIAAYCASSSMWISTLQFSPDPAQWHDAFLPAILPRVSPRLSTLSIALPYTDLDALARRFECLPRLRVLKLCLPEPDARAGHPGNTSLAHHRNLCTVLAGNTPPILPELRELCLCLNVPLSPDSFVGTEAEDHAAALCETLSARARMGFPALARLTIIPYALPPPRRENRDGDTTGRVTVDAVREVLGRVRESLGLALGSLVDALEVVGPVGPATAPSAHPFGGAMLGQLWPIEDDEKYWELEEWLRPQDP